MSKQDKAWGETPATVEQIVAAMGALGRYDGENTVAEHAAEAARLGGPEAYRVRLVNGLLGMVQAEAVMADGGKLDDDARHAAWEEQLSAAGAGLDDPARRVEFLRWQVLRAGTPLTLMARHQQTGPIPLAAAHAVTGLHMLLGVINGSQDAVERGDMGALAAQAGQLQAAREALQASVRNTELLLDMLKSVGL
ncbi:DUF6245 family protein [Streptomyces sp. NPDC056069]|uniref:DUF6245 family protein n=1 Tax=Streptomyces sp. NPDC056069 TaxID=3345702 RepID=UPI0035DEE8AC